MGNFAPDLEKKVETSNILPVRCDLLYEIRHKFRPVVPQIDQWVVVQLLCW
jgi:hypothetical protein